MAVAVSTAPLAHADISIVRKKNAANVDVAASNATEFEQSASILPAPDLSGSTPNVFIGDKRTLTTTTSSMATRTTETTTKQNVVIQQANYSPRVAIAPNTFRLNNPPPYLGCFYASSQKYKVPVDLLLAIAQTESGFRPTIKGGLGWGADHGLMQINDYWLPRMRKQFNITLTDLYEPCTNIEIASWILAHNFVQYRNWTDATGAYNAVTKWKQQIYVRKVKANLEKLYAGKL